MNADQILAALKQSLDDAPKSKAGFVNYNRSKRMQRAAFAKIMELGVDEKTARSLTFEVARPYDTTYSKQAPN